MLPSVKEKKNKIKSSFLQRSTYTSSLWRAIRTRKISDQQSIFTFKGTGKRTPNNAPSEYKEGNNKDQSRKKRNRDQKNNNNKKKIQ